MTTIDQKLDLIQTELLKTLTSVRIQYILERHVITKKRYETAEYEERLIIDYRDWNPPIEQEYINNMVKFVSSVFNRKCSLMSYNASNQLKINVIHIIISKSEGDLV